MKKIKFILPILMIAIIISFVCLNNNETVYASTMTKIDQVSLKITKYLNNLIETNNEKMYLSSPFALMEDNEDYEALVDLGIDAIAPLYTKLKNSNESGLMEYIYAMAIEDIMSQHFEYRESFDPQKTTSVQNSQEDSYKNIENEIDYWSNANEFKIAFSHFMEKLPSEYEKIKNNKELSNESKATLIKELGLGVIPYIVDDINKNNKTLEFSSILNELLLEKKIEVSNVNDWINQKQETIDILKDVSN